MDTAKLMGVVIPGDQKVPVPLRDWSAMKLGLWRSKVGWLIVARQAIEVLDRCEHELECPAIDNEEAPCLEGCPHREQRKSALVILNAARQFAPVNARQLASEPYFAPGRERYSEVLSELAACQAELEALEAEGKRRPPAPNPEPAEVEKRPPLQIPEELK